MTSVAHPGRRAATSLISAGLAVLLAATTAFASTPVTVGYRDQVYGGGAFRPSSDKPQSKLWYTDGSWFAGMFLYSAVTPKKSEYRIYRHDGAHSWTLTSTILDTRDTSHADYLWDETSQTLYVISSVNIPDSLPAVATDDAIKVFKYTYDASTNVYTAAANFPKTIQNTATVPAVSRGGAVTSTIALDSTGDLWAVWLHDNKVKYSKSDNDGDTWSDPAQLPAQVGNSVVADSIGHLNDSAAVIAFGAGSPDKIGVVWSDQDNSPTGPDNGFYFASINAGDDPTVGGNWTTQKLPTLVGTNQTADGHINIKTTSDGSLYMVGKTGTDTANCATNKNSVLTEFFDRTPAGTWSVHLLGTVGDCNTRPQLVISEQLDTAFVFLTSPNGGGTVYRKTAPLSGPDAFVFRGAADQTIQRGTPFIQSATETQIDDPSTTKQVVTSATGIAVIAGNLTTTAKYYLHNELAIPASDSTAPAGTISINAGAAATTSTAVTVAVPATDTGTGVSLVRLSNSSTVSGGVLTTGTTYVYPGGTANLAWTLPGGDGTKTVYAQWRDGKGNWSAVSNDTIVLDTTAPTGTVVINGNAAETTTASVTLTLTTDDGGGSGTTQVLISNSSDFTGVTPRAYGSSIPNWILPAGNGTKTVYVKFIDAAGNVSASPATDTITLNSTDTTNPSAPGAPKQALGGTATYGIPIRLTWAAGSDPAGTGSGVAGYDIRQSINGAAFTTIAQTTGTGTTLDLALSNTSKTYRYQVRTRDLSGNVSAYVTGPTFKAISYNEQSSVLSYSGTWYLVSAPTYIGGKAKYATKAGSTATATISGSKVGWLGRKGPTSGSAKVYVDGVLKATINMYATTTKIRQVLFTYSWATVGTHKLKIVVSGTAGHPRVTLDQILVLR